MIKLEKIDTKTLKKHLNDCNYWIARTIKFISDLQDDKIFNYNLNKYESLSIKTIENKDKHIKKNIKLILEQYEYKEKVGAELKNRK